MSNYISLEQEQVEQMTDEEIAKAHKEWLGNWRYESAAEGVQWSAGDEGICKRNFKLVEAEADKRLISRFEGHVKRGCTYCIESKYFKLVDDELVEVII